DLKVGPRFKPFYPQDRGANLGVSTWPGNSWKTGGAAVWGWISYDPELNLIYHGTSNPGPWNGQQRPGDNKWTAAIIARDASTTGGVRRQGDGAGKERQGYLSEPRGREEPAAGGVLAANGRVLRSDQ